MLNLIIITMNQLEFWLVTTLITVLGLIVWYSIKRAITSIDKVNETVQQLTVGITLHTEQIKNVINANAEHKEDFRILSARVDSIEKTQNKCGYCNENN